MLHTLSSDRGTLVHMGSIFPHDPARTNNPANLGSMNFGRTNSYLQELANGNANGRANKSGSKNSLLAFDLTQNRNPRPIDQNGQFIGLHSTQPSKFCFKRIFDAENSKI